ncbi:MAG: MFS transporter, partial [Bacteroidota bacterium]
EAYAALDVSEKAAIRTSDLGVISGPYIALGLFLILMVVLFFVVKMPEKQGDKTAAVMPAIKRLWAQPKFAGGVIAQAFYVGAQIMCWTYVYQYAESLGISNADAVYYAVAALIIFLVGRFAGTALLSYFSSGRLLMLYCLGAAIATLGAMFLVGQVGLYSLVLISFFMSIMFPTIYGIALEGQKEDAKFGAAFLVMAIVGGALMPVLQGKILDLGGPGYTDTTVLGVPEVNFSFVLPLICFLVVGLYGYNVHSKYPSGLPD